MRFFHKILPAALLALFSASAPAALATSTGPIVGMRIEGTTGFISLTQSMASSSTCGTRVWIDMSTPVGRAVYATALTAFTSRQPVSIRAYEESQRVYGECNLYDIYLPQ